jgi:hypothetical protein
MRPRCTKRKSFWVGEGPKWNRLADRQHRRSETFSQVKSIAYWISTTRPNSTAVLVCQNSQLRDGAANQKSTLKRSPFRKPIRKPTSNTNGNNAPPPVRDGADWFRQVATFFLQLA